MIRVEIIKSHETGPGLKPGDVVEARGAMAYTLAGMVKRGCAAVVRGADKYRARLSYTLYPGTYHLVVVRECAERPDWSVGELVHVETRRYAEYLVAEKICRWAQPKEMEVR